MTDSEGIVRFTSIYPGWYVSRTVHIHVKVHIDRKTVLTTQLFFDDTLSDTINTDMRLTAVFIIKYTILFSLNPPFLVKTSISPRGIPIKAPKNSDHPTI